MSESKRTETLNIPKRKFTVKTSKVSLEFGSGKALGFIAGPCVIDSPELLHTVARFLSDMSQKYGVGIIFKSSYEKDNRGSAASYKGPTMEEGLKLLANVREEYGLPVLSDVHRVEDVNLAAEYLDVLQIPAYMCQQTSLVLECGQTGRPINVKKGQFLAPEGMESPISKLKSVGNNNILLTDRGTCFGYNRLVADIRSIPIMQGLGTPVAFDTTHMIRLYGISSAKPEGGEPQFIPHLTMAGVAAGTDMLFIETHPDPMKAMCDGASQLQMKFFEPLLKTALQVRKAIVSAENVSNYIV